ncbi:phosphatase [Parelaphostrongylus tenuis]|uniref:Phosphatase n=1 Tax=Parelaphostrongylus tenuis TaxID=148309 RepID=A0AAD5QS36_PARTN|nr:phosphatase [Parelaphostrongylus tenuis]
MWTICSTATTIAHYISSIVDSVIWFVMGPARSSAAIHVDPLGTSAWNAPIRGHKRWVLIPLDAPRTIVKPSQAERGKHPDEAVTWFMTVYNRVLLPSWPKEYPVIEAR